MIKRLSTFLFCLFFIAGFLHTQILLEYHHEEGDKWHLTSHITEDVLIDGQLYNQTEILNKISVEVLKTQDGKGQLSNTYQIAEQLTGSNVYTWSAEYEAVYWRNRRGQVSGLKKHPPVPSVRNVPVFPERELSVQDTWHAAGNELFDLEPTYGIDEVISIDFVADYRYIGSKIVDKRRTDHVLIEYSIEWEPDSILLRRFQRYPFFPVAIVGDFKQNVYLDSAAGRNFAEDGQFSYTYFMSDGHSYTFQGRSEGQAIYADPMNREDLIKKIEQLGDVGVKENDKGVTLTLENIHFIPDSPMMVAGEENKLARIANILKKYPQRDILVVGHTAEVYSYSDGVELSRQRAINIAEYFISEGVRQPSQILTRGMGHSQPIASNNTEEGRKMNRRVEITVLEN